MEFRRSFDQEPLAAGVVPVGDFVPSVANPGCEPSSAAGIHSLLHFDAFGPDRLTFCLAMTECPEADCVFRLDRADNRLNL